MESRNSCRCTPWCLPHIPHAQNSSKLLSGQFWALDITLHIAQRINDLDRMGSLPRT